MGAYALKNAHNALNVIRRGRGCDITTGRTWCVTERQISQPGSVWVFFFFFAALSSRKPKSTDSRCLSGPERTASPPVCNVSLTVDRVLTCGGDSGEWPQVTDDGVGCLAGLSVPHSLAEPSTSDGWFGGGLYKAARRPSGVLYVN